MQVLYWLESVRFPLLDDLMLAVTSLGEETAFLVVALILFWCVDKKRGYFTLCVGFAGTLLTHFLKILCRVPRPWVLDGDFTVVGNAKEAAGGYSFPSGHTQTAVGTYGTIACTARNRWVKAGCIAACVLVPFSRMYLGVHTPYDVGVGALLSLALIFGLHPMVYGRFRHGIPVLMGAITVLCVAFLAFVELFPFPEDLDQGNYQSALKNAYTLTACMLGLLAAYWMDEKYLHFPVKAVWWAQVLKTVLGVALVFAVKSGLKAPLEALFSGHIIARGVRYFLIVVVAGVLWPLTFRWFAALGAKKNREKC